MPNDVLPWHYRLCDAVASDDLPAATAILDAVLETGQFDPGHAVDRALRLLIANRLGDEGWLEEAEASLARNADTAISEGMNIDGRVAAYFLAGLMRLGQPERAAAHFAAALALRPGMLAARVELECIRRGVEREPLFLALGEALPRTDWRYVLAASELGLDLGIEAATVPAAICIRGQCTAQTPAVLRLYRTLNPGVPIVMATWKDTPAHLLEACRGLAHIVVTPDLEVPGSQNKNRQMVLARTAITIARPHAQYILLVRTDVSLFAPNILTSLMGVHRAFPPADTEKMKGRLVVSDLFTRRFREYHVSDIMCFGAADDVLRYWSAPYEGPGEYLSTETYLGWHLYEAIVINPPTAEHSTHYRNFLRDYIVVRDFDWFGGFWTRHPHRRNGAGFNFGDACVSQRAWEHLYFGGDPTGDLFGGSFALMYEVLDIRS